MFVKRLRLLKRCKPTNERVFVNEVVKHPYYALYHMDGLLYHKVSLQKSQNVNSGRSEKLNNSLPMPLRDRNFVHLFTIHKPPLPIQNLNIIPTHLPLPHEPIVRKSPIFQPIRTPPLSALIMPLIPELDCNLVESPKSGYRFSVDGFLGCDSTRSGTLKPLTLWLEKANNSFRSLYPFSLSHFLVKN